MDPGTSAIIDWLQLDNSRKIESAALALDRDLGPDWPKAIDLRRLNMSDSDDCVIGQLYGRYRVSEVRSLEARTGRPQPDPDIELAFILVPTEAWREYIAGRLVSRIDRELPAAIEAGWFDFAPL